MDTNTPHYKAAATLQGEGWLPKSMPSGVGDGSILSDATIRLRASESIKRVYLNYEKFHYESFGRNKFADEPRNTGRTLRMLLGLLAMPPGAGRIMIIFRTEAHAAHAIDRLKEIADVLGIPFYNRVSKLEATIGGNHIVGEGTAFNPGGIGERLRATMFDHTVPLEDVVKLRRALRDSCSFFYASDNVPSYLFEPSESKLLEHLREKARTVTIFNEHGGKFYTAKKKPSACSRMWREVPTIALSLLFSPFIVLGFMFKLISSFSSKGIDWAERFRKWWSKV